MLETPVLEIALALVGIQLVVLLYLHYRRPDDEPTATATARESEDGLADRPNEDDAVVECGGCGARNDPGYRYCRRCVADLSGDAVPGGRDRSPSGRLF